MLIANILQIRCGSSVNRAMWLYFHSLQVKGGVQTRPDCGSHTEIYTLGTGRALYWEGAKRLWREADVSFLCSVQVRIDVAVPPLPTHLHDMVELTLSP
jgi:hypothetical protein